MPIFWGRERDLDCHPRSWAKKMASGLPSARWARNLALIATSLPSSVCLRDRKQRLSPRSPTTQKRHRAQDQRSGYIQLIESLTWLVSNLVSMKQYAHQIQLSFSDPLLHQTYGMVSDTATRPRSKLSLILKSLSISTKHRLKWVCTGAIVRETFQRSWNHTKLAEIFEKSGAH